MEFTESARKHGISEADILHALDHAIVHLEQDCEDETRMLIIHADRMRPKFNEILHRGRKR
jgi:nickel-dependent lactate racemase